jgi:hypothetical protein
VVSIRRYAIELGENIPSRLPGKIKASVIGWSMLPLLVGAVGLAQSWSPALIRFGQIGVVAGLVLSLVSGIDYTVSFVRIYQRTAAYRGESADRQNVQAVENVAAAPRFGA